MSAKKVEAALSAFFDASDEFRRAGALAFNEGARVNAAIVNALLNGLPIDLDALKQDADGCRRLGEKAIAAENKWKATTAELNRLLRSRGES